MAKYVQGKDGKFAGSIGDGKSRPPTISEVSATLPERTVEEDPHGILAIGDFFAAYRERMEADPGVREARDLDTTPERLEELAREDVPEMQWRHHYIASHPNTNVTTQRLILRGADEPLMHDLIDAHQNDMAEEIQIILAAQEDEPSVLRAMANLPCLTPRAAWALYLDAPDKRTVLILAVNPTIPADLREDMLLNEDPEIRAHAVWNENVDTATIERLRDTDSSAAVRMQAQSVLVQRAAQASQ